MNKINFSSIQKTLSPKEMKNVLGGSGGCCFVACANGGGATINCDGPADCASQCDAICGDDGWQTNCY